MSEADQTTRLSGHKRERDSESSSTPPTKTQATALSESLSTQQQQQTPLTSPATDVVSLMQNQTPLLLSAHAVSINGGLNPSLAKKGCFVYVNPRQGNREDLISLISRGNMTGTALFQVDGPRSSGKSTYVCNVAQQLQPLYEVFVFTCPAIEPFTDTPNLSEFWRLIYCAVMDLCRARGLKSAASSSRWEHGGDFYAWLRGDHFGGRRVVLFCDEFDRIYSAHPRVRNNVLHTLHDLRDSTSNLQAFVGVGSFALLDFVGDSDRLHTEDPKDYPISPFSSRNTLQIKYFDRGQCEDYNAQFERLRGITVCPDVREDIINLTGCHPGLFALCYWHMEEMLIDGRGRPHESLDAWRPLRRSLVSSDKLLTYSTMKKMTADLNADSPQATAARNLLSSLLTASEPFSFRDREWSAARFLARVGVIRMSDEEDWKIGKTFSTMFQLSSPLIRPLAARFVFPPPTVPSIPVPCIHAADLNVPTRFQPE